MNIRLTLQVMVGDKCLRSFDVEVYDHFGDMTVTKWGEERTTCENANIAAPELESLMLEGTTVMGSYEPDQKAGDSHSEDPSLDAEVEGNDAEESNDIADEANDKAEKSNDSADEADDEEETGADDDNEVEEEN